MSSLPFDLRTLQTWLQSVLMDADSPPGFTPVRIEEVITASQQQTSRERVHVYYNAYQARLVECLREEFVTLCKFLEQDVFDSLARAYLQAYPSQSYTLADLGAKFPLFLHEAAEGFANADSESADGGTQFLIDLATLERLYAEVFDGPGIEGLPLITPDDLKGISPDAWPQVRFVAAPCLRLIRFDYPVHEFVTACRHGAEPPVPEPHPTWLAVTRRQYIVRRVSLTEPQFQLLTLLSQGLTLGVALDTVASSIDNVESFAKDVQQWFREWTACGFFVGLEVRK